MVADTGETGAERGTESRLARLLAPSGAAVGGAVGAVAAHAAGIETAGGALLAGVGGALGVLAGWGIDAAR